MTDAPGLSSELSALHWQAAPPDSLNWAHFSDQWAVYHRPSGKTHFVNAATERLLRELLVEPLTFAELLPRLLENTSAEERDEIQATTLELLLRLELLGLIHCQ